MDAELRKKLEQVISTVTVLQTEFNGHRIAVQENRLLQDAKHAQNRKDIHDVRDSVQTMGESFTLKLMNQTKELLERFDSRNTELTQTIHSMQIKESANSAAQKVYIGVGIFVASLAATLVGKWVEVLFIHK